MKKRVSKLLCCLLTVLFIFTGCTVIVSPEDTTAVSESTTRRQEETTDNNKVTISKEVSDLAQDTKEEVKSGNSVDTSEVVEGSSSSESKIEDEQAIEQDAKVEQEDISYDGTNSGKGLKLLGACTGLTYYNQGDRRWGYLPYTTTGSRSQTIKSSGCGPTSAAMVVSSSKGAILPSTMANLFVDNGYRTKNNGTAWSVWSFVADYFDFKEYYTTSSTNKMLNYLKTDKDKDGVADYFVVASCGSGLFTTGGHYIVLVADDSGTITVYDPYLYSGKFNTASRRAARVKVSGNSAYVTESKFKTYGNTKNYWIFSNDHKTSKKKSKKNTSNVSYTKYVSTSSQSLNVRTSPNGSIKTTIKKGTKVKVTKVSGGWSHISSPVKGWIASQYLSSTKVVTKKKVNYKTKVGQSYRLSSDTNLYQKGSLTGTVYHYKKLTQVKVVSHYSSTVDKVKVVKTGRVAYVKVNRLK